jgi:hypothetical protein
MDFGVDTFRSRLDLIRALSVWADFRQWNGGNLIGGVVVGGEPRFAGRHFLGGDGFIWGHGEATDCMTNPNPEHLELLLLSTVSIAPMQAAFTKRQQLTGVLAYLYGRIDGQAVCDRITASLMAGEFVLPSTGQVLVWLNVDPTAPLSGDYWAGWADRVNNYAFFTVLPGDGPAVPQPFRAAVQCRFQSDGSGKLRPDPQVPAALTAARTSWPGKNTTSHGCWADAPIADPPDWAAFAGGPTPLIWKTSHGFSQGGSQPDNYFDVDAANPGGAVAKATDFMLIAQPWQPNVPSLQNFGIINQDPVTATQITAVQAASIPKMKDTSGHLSIEEDHTVHFIGRYLQPSLVPPNVVGRREVESLSRARLDTFTIWEDRSAIAANQNINYFDPANAAGTFDGQHAFAYCGDVLRQPPHTPVFFTIDNFDPAVGTAAQVATAKSWITQYVTLLKRARDDYAVQNPDRPYLVGLYTNGEVLRWCYEAGDLDMFWQSGSGGTSGNTWPNNRPWFHASRWQFNVDAGLAAAGWTAIHGADPDADWGDGGTWNLRDPLWADLEQISSIVKALAHGATFGQFGNLVWPAQP